MRRCFASRPCLSTTTASFRLRKMSASSCSEGSTGPVVSAKLREHVKSSMSNALSAWPAAIDTTVRTALSGVVVDCIEAVTREEVTAAATSKAFNKKLCDISHVVERHLKYSQTRDLPSGGFSVDDIKRIIDLEQDRDAANGKIFEDITSHHHDIQKKSWEDTVADANELATYAQAASQMGEKRWVKHANDWMRGACYRFFCGGGARKALVKKMKKSTQIFDFSALNFSENLMENKDTSSSSAVYDKKIRILDVGACYNPLTDASSASSSDAFTVGTACVPQDSLDVLGVDLYPANPSVLQCDFLNVSVTAPNTNAERAPAVDMVGGGGGYERVVSLPAESFDAAVMCLVLSYLPDGEQRLEMVRNARKLLIRPSAADGPEPHRTGLLVIVEKVSVFGNNNDSRKYINEWRDSIEKVGFEMISTQCLAGTNNHAYGMIFRKVELPVYSALSAGPIDGTGGALHTRRELVMKMRMKMKQQKEERGTGMTGLEENDSDESCRKRMKTAHPPPSPSPAESPVLLQPQPLLHVAIVGGGIGGLALALALHKIKYISFKLYEKDETFSCRKQGYALTIQQGLSSLRVLGIDRELLDRGITSTEHISYDMNGNLLGIYGPNSRVRSSVEFKMVEAHMKSRQGSLSSSDSDGSTSDSSVEGESPALKGQEPGPKSAKRRRHNVHISRQSLRQMMLDKVDPSCIAWGHRLVDVTPTTISAATTSAVALDDDQSIQPETQITLKFDNAHEAKADIVVSADGIYSQLRQLLFPCRQLNYLGLLVILGISNRPEGEKEVGKYRKVQWVDGTTRVFSMPFDKDKVMWQLSFPIGDEQAALVASETAESLHAAALAKCEGWDDRLMSVVRQTDLSLISGHPVYDIEPCSEETNDRESLRSRGLGGVTFLGDAVHAMSPFKGQGANVALADAITLATELSSLCDHLRFQQPDLKSPQKHSVECKDSLSKAVDVALMNYERVMTARAASKVLKSREAAVCLHSEAAMASGNTTRVAAAAAVADYSI